MDLYNLPKDILIEIIKKNYDFTKLSIDQVENIHSEISKRAKARYLDELRKNGQILETRYDEFAIEVNSCKSIKVRNLKIKLYYNAKYEYELQYYAIKLNYYRKFKKHYKRKKNLFNI